MFNELVVALITGIIIFTYSLVIRSLRLRGLRRIPFLMPKIWF